MAAMNTYITHPLADIFPMMSAEVYASLRDDVRVHGLVVPIVLFEGMILDGRNRYKACQELGISPAFETYSGDDPIHRVMSLNKERRHLTQSQRAAAAVKASEHYKEAAQIRKLSGDGGKRNHSPNLEHGGRAIELAAKELGVTPSYAYEAQAIMRADSGVFQEVVAGELTVNAATAKIRGHENKPTAVRSSRAEAAEQIRELAASGHNSRQIAALLGRTSKSAHQTIAAIAREHGIALPDAVIGKAHRINAKRVIEQTVNGLVGYAHGIETIGNKWDDVTKEDVSAWIEDLGRSLRIINRLMKSLREFAQ